ncbi:amino acid adenylation domain-containing protein [Streptomyces sp. NBC_00239]
MSFEPGKRAIPPRPEPNRAPLSYIQRSIWRAEQVLPGSALHNESAAFRLHGPLDADRLVRAVDEVTGRHEALRCRISEGAGGEPVQVFPDTAGSSVERIDLTGLPEHERDGRVAELFATATTAPFELSRVPPVRILLVRLGADEHALLLVAHHIAVDAWGFGVFLDEVTAAFTEHAHDTQHTEPTEPAEQTGGPAETPEAAPGFGDFAAWQQTRFDAEEHLGYWRGRLSGDLPAVDFPAAPGPTSASGTDNGSQVAGRLHHFTVPAELAADLAALGRTELSSLSTVLLTAFCAVVKRRTGQDVLNLGMPVATRNAHGLSGVVGPLLNVMVHRADLSGDPTFREALQRTRTALKNDLRHRDTPLDLILQDLGIGAPSLFRLMYAFHSGPATTLRLPGVDTVPMPSHSGTAKHDLSLFVRPRPSGRLDLSLEYRTAVLDDAAASDLARSLVCLLRAVVEDAGRPLGELPLLTQAERRRVVVDFNVGSQDRPWWPAVPAVLRDLARRNGTAGAVSSGATRLSRADADAAADRVAARLAAQHAVGPGDRVALRVTRDAALVPLMVGVWRAGAVLVPLDEALPPERVAHMVDDSGARAVIVDVPADEDRGAAQIRADALLAEGETEDGSGPVPFPDGPAPADLAYLMYTSGSTGAPKGVAVTHGNLANLLHSVIREPGMSEDDVLLAVTSIGFDICMLELFAPLAAGGQVVIAPREAVLDVDALAALPADCGATLMQATPSLWRALTDDERPPLRPGLRVLSGGEPLDAHLADRLLSRYEEVWNLYGPTETTVWSTAGRVHRGEPVTVGRPIGRTRCYLLGRDDRPVRPGSVGELVIGGAGVSAGYWNRPELTGSAFVPDPVDPAAGPVYRTGDLGRYLPDGRIVILGRADAQVKILGHRIEPGEIEAVLLDHPAVRNAAVVADRSSEGAPRLAAFVVTDGDTDGREPHTALRAWLRRRLPAAVVPAALFVLPALPLNTSGKVDRPALVRIARRPAPEPSGAEPGSPLERTVAGLWAEALDVDPHRVRMADDFLTAGGNSLSATRLLARARRTVGAAPSLADFYQDPTPAALARSAAGAGAAMAETEATDTAAAGTSVADAAPVGPVPLTDQQRQLWLLHRLAPASPAYNLAASVHLGGPVDIAALEAALAELAARHEILTARCELHDGRPVFWRQDHLPVPLDVLDADGDGDGSGADDAVTALAAAEAARPFDLAAGPLMRATVVRTRDRGWHLLLSAHHIALDGWSAGVVLRDLGALYAHRTGAAEPPPRIRSGFSRYAAEAAGPRGEAVRTDQLAYWADRLDGCSGVLQLPSDAAGVVGGEDGTLPVAVPEELTARLRQTAVDLRTTPFTVLLTVFGSLLGRYAGTDDVVVGVPVANRDRPELDTVVGSLVNMLPVRIDLSGSATFAGLAARTAGVLARDLDHALVPLDHLVSRLRLDRSSARTPLVQATLTLQDAPPGELGLGGASGRLRPLSPGAAKYDIALSLDEHAGRLDGRLEYSGTRFGPASAARVLTHLFTLLRAALDDPDRSLDTVDLTDDVQPSPRPVRRRGEARRDHSLPVHEVFRRRAAENRDAVAVRHEGVAVGYGSLDDWSDRIAGRLGALGAAPGRFVSVLVHTGPVQVAAALGVAKAGAAFCVLAPGDPDHRLTELLADADPLCLLAEEAALTAHPGLWDPAGRRFAGVPVEVVEPDCPGAPPTGPPPTPAAVSGADPLCLVYTSGSTGTPKGIVLPHATFSQLADWEREYYGIRPGGRIAQWAPFTYDAAYSDMFAALCAGATLCVVPEDRRRDPLAVAAWLRTERITRLGTVPAFFQLITEALEATGAHLPDLEHVQLAGEAVPVRLVEAWAHRPDRPRLHNLYGPTECVIATYRELLPEETFPSSVPVGVPIPGREVLVLDHRGRPCPVGVPGEILLRSDFLAGSYHRRPQESARAYVPDPWEPEGKLYRTGDLGCHLPDGQLGFVGRLGSQVKIRGNRVELEGIEAVLESHPSVREAAATVHHVGGVQRLVGYAVVAPGVDGAQLRDHLAARLPAPAVPDTVMLLDALPRTRTNKRDRTRLPLPAPPAAATASPLAGVEQLVADAWRQVLGGGPVGRHTNFFEAGGDSLRAAQLQLELSRVLGREIPLVDLFARPTVAEFAGGLVPVAADRMDTDTTEERGSRRRAAVRGRAAARRRARGPVDDDADTRAETARDTDAPTRVPRGSS